MKAVKSKADSIQDEFQKEHSSLPMVLHCDGKVIKYNTGEEDDRLCIKASFRGNEKPDQFLAAPAINPPDGLTMSNTIINTLTQYAR